MNDLEKIIIEIDNILQSDESTDIIKMVSLLYKCKDYIKSQDEYLFNLKKGLNNIYNELKKKL